MRSNVDAGPFSSELARLAGAAAARNGVEELMMQLQPHVFFQGRCDEAIAFYEQALGAKRAMRLRFKDNPEVRDPVAPDWADEVMHARLEIGGAALLMSDGHGAEGPNFQGFALTLSLPAADSVDRAFAALEVGGVVLQPLQKTFFSSRFAMLCDRFGVTRILLVG
jgi:PhnB protein